MSIFSALLTTSAAGQGLDTLLSPGPLSEAHSELTGLENCASCHSAGKGVEPQKCLACHRDLEERIRKGNGFHRQKARDCVRCHSDHHGNEMQLVRFSPEGFDHQETGYPLEGLHLEVKECERCHSAARAPERVKTKSFLLEDKRCLACHDDPHGGELGENCLKCHPMERKFRTVQFDHDLAAFPLRGAHQSVDCKSCHRGTSFKGLRFSHCQDCHQDPHQPSVGADCERCHEPSSWAALGPGFKHDRTAFPLEGMHRKVDCARCHPNQRFKNLSFARCSDCHKRDPHLGQFQNRDCSSCHSVQGFRKTSFEHRKASFPLTGKHGTVPCAQCHSLQEGQFPGGNGKAVRFRPLSTTCISCHADVHLGQLANGCDACHTTSGFKRETLLFQHQKDSRFALRGRHEKLDCAPCHRRELGFFPTGTGEAVRFRPLSARCAACHRNPHDPRGHDENARLSQPACERCHTVESFVKNGFDHESTEFPLRGKHASLVCEQCHRFLPHKDRPIVTFQKLESGCADCHRSPHSARQNNCRACHDTRSFRVRAW